MITEEKEIKIVAPEGYEIDRENSTLDCIKFKLKAKRWVDNEEAVMEGFYITSSSSRVEQSIHSTNTPENYNTFATEKQAKSALAMARISQIMANDARFGGAVTDEEWKYPTLKYALVRCRDEVTLLAVHTNQYRFLTFHTAEQADLFAKENEKWVRDYLMLS